MYLPPDLPPNNCLSSSLHRTCHRATTGTDTVSGSQFYFPIGKNLIGQAWVQGSSLAQSAVAESQWEARVSHTVSILPELRVTIVKEDRRASLTPFLRARCRSLPLPLGVEHLRIPNTALQIALVFVFTIYNILQHCTGSFILPEPLIPSHPHFCCTSFQKTWEEKKFQEPFKTVPRESREKLQQWR